MMLHKCCLNTVRTLLAECSLVKMQMYTEKEMLRWIDAELDTDPHNEMLVLGDAEVEGCIKNMMNYCRKRKMCPQMISHHHQRKRNHQNLKVFSLLGIHLFYIQ